ncbi:MAG: response regulator transcription factor, partial [Anaerotignum sp.]
EACDGIEAIAVCGEVDIDVIIMDIMMPRLDGFGAISEIRKTKDIPVIILSAKGEDYDKVLGFELGIDDYVVKTASTKELMFRVKAILRRSSAKVDDCEIRDVFRYKDLIVDITAYSVTVDDKVVKMANKEYELLFYLIKNINIVVPRNKILEVVWGYDFIGYDRTLDTHIKLIRKNLGKYGTLIKTLRGVGYKFEV